MKWVRKNTICSGERRADASEDTWLTWVSLRKNQTVSHGEAYPLDPAQTEEAYAKNRRAHFVVSLEK